MALLSVHRCLQLGAENEQLLKKLKKLQTKNKELEKDLAQIQEEGRQRQLARGYVSSRDVQIQTDKHLWRKGGYNKDLNLEGESARLNLKMMLKKEENVSMMYLSLRKIKLKRLLQLYNNLQKHYVKEMKTNQEQSETIRNLTMKIHELEHNLQEQKQRIEQLERSKVLWKTNAVSGKRSRTLEGEIVSHRDASKKESCCSKYLELLLKEIKKLKKENEKLSAERRALRKELAGLDKEFFEEIEDLKRAVQESAKLNNQYEKCLKQISVIFGLPFTAHL